MTTTTPIRISLWSGPRNVSTALMYAFAQRNDTQVFDEPLYAHYLSKTDADSFHPGATDILQAQENDGTKVVHNLLLGESESPVVFFKNMAHHLVKLDWDFLKHLSNVLLIRDPRDMLHSYSRTIEDFDIKDTGYPQLKEVCEKLLENGKEPFVIDSCILLEDPEKELSLLCEFIGIDFDSQMLSWEVGPKAFEGVWAPHWYDNIHRSSSFKPYKPKKEPFPERLGPLLERCQPYYDYLMQFARK
ncbi:sulfotransferase family protein [Opitutia bacterium ISCC 51]|nr:sulfotransferase family protein [Opitutae bacterium ISCC 51]QXD29895.1 sulfotransferase family protein [Opitutae bacterium ISCC 52]